MVPFLLLGSVLGGVYGYRYWMREREEAQRTREYEKRLAERAKFAFHCFVARTAEGVDEHYECAQGMARCLDVRADFARSVKGHTIGQCLARTVWVYRWECDGGECGFAFLTEEECTRAEASARSTKNNVTPCKREFAD